MPYSALQTLDPTVNVLLLEDSAIDAELICEYLRQSSVPLVVRRVATGPDFSAAVEAGGFQLILSDYSLPGFDGLEAFKIARAKAPDIPFIFVSGVLGEEIAIECLKQGATDYVLKPRLSRLPAAVDRAMKEAREREQRKRVELRTRLLVAELSHRVKNTLMTVVSLARQTLRRSTTLEAFEHAFMGRLQSLAAAHALLLRSNWEDMDLAELVAESLKPFRRRDGGNIVASGQPVLLPPRLALTLNLILHELATNAAKYGSLSVEQGRVEIAWSVETGDARRLLLTWRETGGPPVPDVRPAGFGTTLIRRSAGFEMGGDVAIEFEKAGVVCRLDLPLDAGAPEEREVRPDIVGPARATAQAGDV
jgi:two-component sensor histidine kinase/CheY-like chemotaxis protein